MNPAVKNEVDQRTRIVLDNIKKRWSCRVFGQKPVSREVIDILLDAANNAPSPKNSQPWEFIMLQGEPLQKLHEVIFQCRKHKESELKDPEKTSLFPEGDFHTTLPKHLMNRQKKFLNGISKEIEKFGIKLKDVYQNTYYFHYAPSVILVVGDSVKRDRHGLEIHQTLAAAIQNILLAAYAMRYDSCWIGDVMRFGKQLNEHLGMGKMKEIVGGVALGHQNKDMKIELKKVQKQSLDGKVKWLGF